MTTWTHQPPRAWVSDLGVIVYITAERWWWFYPADGTPRIGPFATCGAAEALAEECHRIAVEQTTEVRS